MRFKFQSKYDCNMKTIYRWIKYVPEAAVRNICYTPVENDK